MKIILVVMACYALVSVTGYLANKLNIKHDGVLEELVEDAIENETGISVDLTPDSPETK